MLLDTTLLDYAKDKVSRSEYSGRLTLSKFNTVYLFSNNCGYDILSLI